jgi:hypothetical protein
MRVPGWLIALSVCAFFGALVAWVVHVPSAPVVVPPFDPPKVKKIALNADAGAAPEDEPVGEDLPAMPVGTVDLPEHLDRQKLETGMEKIKKHLDKCRGLEPFTGTLTVRLAITTSGNVKSAQVVPAPAAPSPLAECVVKAVKHYGSFPRFKGSLIPVIELTYPFLFKDGSTG